MNIAQLGLGEVRHRRLRPREHAFVYPSYFLWLPMRALRREASPGLNRNGRGWLSFHDADHGDGGADALAWAETLLAAEGITDADGEVWLQTYPRVLGYVFKPVSFFASAATARWRRSSSKSTTPSASATAICCAGPSWPGGASSGPPRSSMSRPSAASKGATGFASCAQTDVSSRGSITTMPPAPLQPLTRRSARTAFFAMPALTMMLIIRIHWQALRLAIKRVPFFSKPEPPERFVTR